MTYTRLFALRRDQDPTGVSGVGTVAYGAVLPDGRTIVQWMSDRPSTVVWRRAEDAEYIHSHGGTAPTSIVWLEPDPDSSHGGAEWVACLRAVDGGMQLLGDVAANADQAPAGLDRIIRELVAAKRDNRPIDFKGLPVAGWLQQLLLEELTGAGHRT